MKRYFVLLLAAVISFGCCRSNQNVKKTLSKVAQSGEVTVLSEVTPFQWDCVYVIGPYQAFDTQNVQGLPNRVRKTITAQEMLENQALLVFTLNNNYVSYSEVDIKTINKLGLKSGTYTPDLTIPL